MYRAITADGRPYGTAGYSWDLVILAAQVLLLYDRKVGAREQPVLQRALNAVSVAAPRSFGEAVRAVVMEYAMLAAGSAIAGRRLRHAVATVEEWDGQGWRRPLAGRQRRRSRGQFAQAADEGKAGYHGPRGRSRFGLPVPKGPDGKFRRLADEERLPAQMAKRWGWK